MKRRKNKEYKISYQYRIKVKDGTYKLISHQVLIIDEDSQGQVLTTIGVHSDISHLVSNNNYKVSFLAIGDNKSYINLSPNDDSFESSSGNYSLTKRETEVIRLVSEGLSTKEIASYLYISTHTVTNHKTNSMKKLGVATINELVVTSLKSGIL
ncbi:UNVERIFIED_CONTAM: hypothetical protein GTU68_064332 [Idotea baltica]|nr:hypothetical protein [Idotea baltica]